MPIGDKPLDLTEDEIATAIVETYEKLKNTGGGKVASYIPELKKVSPKLYAISICTVDGVLFSIGDDNTDVAIESVSKVFTLALAIKKKSTAFIRSNIGSTHSPLPFNSINAANKSETHTLNPFVNAGAMATTSILYETNRQRYIKKLFDNMSEFAGRKIKMSPSVYKSESATNHQNKSLAYLLKSYNRFYGDVDKSVDAYTAQCSALVNSKDLSVMAATFASGGTNPITHKKLLTPPNVEYILREMACNGLYEKTGKWFDKIGIPIKSGVSGSLLIVVPGVMGIGIISPPLSEYGNSVKGLKTAKMLSDKLDLTRYYSLASKCKQMKIKK